MIKITVAITLLAVVMPLAAKEVEGVEVPESVTLSNGKTVLLNGAGVRTKFFFDIYVGALYLETKLRSAAAIFQDEGSKRVLMHFVYDKVAREKLIDGWNDGFKANHTSEQMEKLRDRLEAFNSLFSLAKQGDEFHFDYLPGTGTEVWINKNRAGTIAGRDFHTALLKVWLGDEPADGDLKAGMLGAK